MARIKTREVDHTSIKTMNRSVSASHRIRNAGAEIRQNVRQQSDVQEQSVSEYSTARVEEGMQKAAWKAEHAAEIDIAKTSKYAKQKLQERRLRASSIAHEADHVDYGNYKGADFDIREPQCYQGKDVVYHQHEISRDRMPRYDIRSKEIRGCVNTSPLRETYRTPSRKETMRGSARIKTRGNRRTAFTKSFYTKPQSAMRNSSRKSYRMKASGNMVRQMAESVERTTKTLFFGAKTLIAGIVGMGSVAVVIIVICCFLGCVMYFSEEGEYEDYKPMIVTVAESQLGNEGGEPFWSWYGFDERVDWCAIFVSWCGEQCGYLDTEILPKFAVVGDGAEWFKEKRQWKTRRYTPKAGDIVFFDWEDDGVMDHVGIVERYENKTVYTIEGNSGDLCRLLQYEVKSKVISGYGVINTTQDIKAIY